MFSKDVMSARAYLQDTCVSAMHSYLRLNNLQYEAGKNPLNIDNLYCETIKYWPLYALGLLKSAAFADVKDVLKYISVDVRVSILVDILSMNSLQTLQLIRFHTAPFFFIYFVFYVCAWIYYDLISKNTKRNESWKLGVFCVILFCV